eukprot:4658049-Amphidinium_carterae.1
MLYLQLPKDGAREAGQRRPIASSPKCTACGVRPAKATSRNGVKDAGPGVKFRLEKVRSMRPSTLPLKLRLGTPADSTKQEFSSIAVNATRECRLCNWNSLL